MEKETARILLSTFNKGLTIGKIKEYIDLHGFNTYQCNQILNVVLDRLIASKSIDIFQVIVGAGNHNKSNPDGILKSTVEDLLYEKGLNYFADHVNGQFLVQMKYAD